MDDRGIKVQFSPEAGDFSFSKIIQRSSGFYLASNSVPTYENETDGT
jgi:hypothetical protein